MRSADRRVDVLGCGLSQRDGQLRSQRLHSGSSAAFERHGTERVYIAYDRDEAGDKAAAKLAEELMGMGIECFRVQFPKGQDANEYALKTQPATKALGVLLTGAAWMGKGPRPAVRVQVPVIVAQPPAAAPAYGSQRHS